MDGPPEEKILVLEEMGIPRKQAVKALLKYSDVEFAADSIFSGNTMAEDEEEPPPLVEEEEPTKSRTTVVEVNEPIPMSDANFNLLDGSQMIEKAKPPTFSQQGLEDAFASNVERQMNTAIANSFATHTRDAENHSSENHTGKKAKIPTKRNTLRTWTDPQSPLDRQRLNDSPVGLRPHPGEHYVNPFLQTLFHIPIVRRAVWAHRLTLNSWGNLYEYWKGSSMPTMHRMFGGGSIERNSFAGLYELQKLFGFMQLTKRAYGDSKNVLSALHISSKLGDEYANVAIFYKELLKCFGQDSTSLFRNDVRLERWEVDPNTGETTYEMDNDHETYQCLSFIVGPNDTSIYSALDKTFYEGSQYYKQLAFLTRVADVLVLCWGREGRRREFARHRDLRIDKIFYPSRYSWQQREEVVRKLESRKGWAEELEQVRLELACLNQYEGSLKSADLLRGSREYFGSVEIESSRILVDFLAKALASRQNRARDLESRLAELERIQDDVFDTVNETEPYFLRAVLVNEGNTSAGKHVAYIWVTSVGGEGQWMRFADTHVEPVSEDQALNDRSHGALNLGVYSLVYVSAEAELGMNEVLMELKGLVPDGLRYAVNEDNKAFALKVQEHLGVISVDEDDQVMAWGAATEIEETLSLRKGSDHSLPDQHDVGRSRASVPDEVSLLMKMADDLIAEDFRILQRFEYFLAKIENPTALQHLVSSYVESLGNLEEPLQIKPFPRQDIILQPMYEAYAIYKDNTEVFVKALECIQSDEYSRAVDMLLTAKQRESMWVNGWVSRAKVVAAVPRADAVARHDQIERYGKACLKILNNNAYQKAIIPAYRTRGFEDAIRLTLQTRSLLGVDRFLQDSFVSNLRNQWLNYSDNIADVLDPSQAEIHNNLVMLFIDDTPLPLLENSSITGEVADVVEIREGLGFDSSDGTVELWKRYQIAISFANNKLKSELLELAGDCKG